MSTEAAVRQADEGSNSRQLRVLVTNSITLNGGDAAIVEATASSLRKAAGAEIQFTIFDRQPDAAAKLFPKFEFRPWPWDVFFPSPATSRLSRAHRRVTRLRAYAAAFLLGRGARRVPKFILKPREWQLLLEYAEADLVVSKGGTYLVEIYDLAPHLFDFRLCMLLRRPLVLAAQSLGPFNDPRTQRALSKVFRRALVFVRDEKSLEHIQRLGVNSGTVRISADCAFALADPDVLTAARVRPLRKPLSVAVSVREWRHFQATDPASGMERYANSLRALVGHLVRHHDSRVTFLSTCQGLSDYWTDDSVVARQIVETLPQDVEHAVVVDHHYHTPAELLEELANFDLAVSTRMHFAILALAAGVPVLPIAYEFKTIELFRRLGMATEVLDIETIEPEEAVSALDAFIATLPVERETLFEQVEGQRILAEESAKLIAASLPNDLQSG
jgi:colanic acid/amylovoran biosynthesis protein